MHRQAGLQASGMEHDLFGNSFEGLKVAAPCPHTERPSPPTTEAVSEREVVSIRRARDTKPPATPVYLLNLKSVAKRSETL